ncbi:MAG: OprO/OprP family phosphate-selective porin [Bacteroidales bacterium]|nr:OprO/OprP family phosphate-selective porin [Bacteroidales bacterium]
MKYKKTAIGIMAAMMVASATASAQTENDEASKAKQFLTDVADRIHLHGYAQAGYTLQHKGGETTNTFDIKRTLLWAIAQINEKWSFMFMHDFNSQVQEFYTDYRVTNGNQMNIRFGQFKNCLTLENPLSPTSMETIDVYSESVTFLTGCGSDPLFGVQYGRDLGMAIFGELGEGKVRYEVNILNGQGINRKDRNKQKDIIGRLEFRPFSGFNIVVTGQKGKGHAVATSLYNPEIQIGDNYRRDRFSVGFDYKSRPFNIHSEYVAGKDGKVVSRGAYVTGSVALVPTKLDLIASYDIFDFNDDLDMEQQKIVAGIQWWYFKRCRLQVQYVHKNAYTTATEFVKGGNNSLMCQMQIRFN